MFDSFDDEDFFEDDYEDNFSDDDDELDEMFEASRRKYFDPLGNPYSAW